MNNPISLARVSGAIKTALSSDPETAKYTVLRSEVVNEDPARALGGWVGIYRSGCGYIPRTLGLNAGNFKIRDVSVLIVVQATDLTSGERAEDQLEEYVYNVMRVILADPSLRGLLGTINSIDVTYSYKMRQETTAYFQEALLLVKGESKT